MTFTLNITTAEQRTAATREALLADVAGIRWQRETGGITLQDGSVVATDERSTAKLTATVTSLQNGMVTAPINFKFPQGWQPVSQAEIEAVAAAVAQHVQSCFDAELTVSGQIDALTDAEVLTFDVAAAFAAAMEMALETGT
ncbi:DUF4376 domain-containing protein [Leisingera aquaemixtae]|uniref:DUF4376 domain-containing protein n=1 Tax=Leisingera aquaemixtae TaxID=1396826 RepID=A0A0P1HLL2_9RHOB|nr:DUF4376 domain-containing protein [Leisingera aquaemixtae]CUH99859.1 hypothetical protein PHA8399_01985 [Leisingera aquaemixtae]